MPREVARSPGTRSDPEHLGDLWDSRVRVIPPLLVEELQRVLGFPVSLAPSRRRPEVAFEHECAPSREEVRLLHRAR